MVKWKININKWKTYFPNRRFILILSSTGMIYFTLYSTRNGQQTENYKEHSEKEQEENEQRKKG